MNRQLNFNDRIFIAGHRGMVGSAIERRLREAGYNNLLVRTRDELDLKNQAAVGSFLQQERPDCVVVAAATVGGILANSSYPADFLYDNLMIECNLIHGSWLFGVRKLLFLGSSCIYPKFADQPIQESSLLTGPLEWTNEPYGIAKIAGIKMCAAYNRQYGTNFISVMPTNLYGINDNYDLERSHVLPALIRRMHEAKLAGADSVTVWGTGKPRRELLFADDLADACVFLLESFDAEAIGEVINIGTGADMTISELALTVKEIVGFKGQVVFDTSKPDGTPRKVVDTSRLSALGWRYKTELSDGIATTYEDFLKHHALSS